jgi:hypothetical protein
MALAAQLGRQMATLSGEGAMSGAARVEHSLLHAALAEAERRGARWIGPEHLLVAAAAALPLRAPSGDALRAAVDALLGPTPVLPGAGDGPPLAIMTTNAAGRALQRAHAAAVTRGRATAGPADVLAALTDGSEDPQVAREVLRTIGVDPERMRAALGDG